MRRFTHRLANAPGESLKLRRMGTNPAGRREQRVALLALWLAGASAALIFCVSLSADATEPAAKSEAPPTTAKVEPDAEATGEFTPPPGFRPKKRGDLVVYCRKELVLGSRFPAEKCYDQAGLRELRLVELERTEMLERMMACSNRSCWMN